MYKRQVGNGLVTDMNAIRRDEEMDNLHSIYVDQWDWEKVITREERTTEYLKQTVQKIVDAVCGTLDELKWQFPALEDVYKRQANTCRMAPTASRYTLLPAARRNWSRVWCSPLIGSAKGTRRHALRAPSTSPPGCCTRCWKCCWARSPATALKKS